MTCTNYGLTGGKFCSKGNPMGIPTGIYFTTPGTTINAADFLLEATYQAAIKNETIYPINGADLFKGMEEASAETRYHEFPNQSRSTMQQKVVRLVVVLDPNECQKKEILKFRNFNGRIFIEYGNWIRGTSTDAGATVKGARLAMVNVESGMFNLSDGTKGTMRMVIDLLTEKDFDDYDYAREMAWDVLNLDGLTEVDLEQTGAASATGITIKVSGKCYGQDYPIEGLTVDDFVITGTGALTSASENTPGEYTFVGTTIANDDTINLVSAATISDDDLFIKSSGAATISGI